MANSIEILKSEISKGNGPAQRNLYSVELPTDWWNVPGSTLNYLCTAAIMPGRSITTHERRTDMVVRQVAYGFAVEPVTLTFKVLNDSKIRAYWENWQRNILGGYEISYFNDYVREIKINQLKRGMNLSILNKNFSNKITKNVPPEILGAISSFASGTVGVGTSKGSGIQLTGDLAQGDLSLGFVTRDQITYTCTLHDAYPTNISTVEYGDDQNEFVNYTVTLTYRDWSSNSSVYAREQGRTYEGLAGSLITKAIGKLL